MDESEYKALADKIIVYMDKYPDAADCVEGIAQWWLPRQNLEESVRNIECALEYLYKQNKVSKKILPGGRVIWSKQK